MVWDIKDVLTTLNQAIQLEQEGRDFYLGAARRTKDPAGQKMFASLAADEQEHYVTLKREYDSVASAGKWLNAVDTLVREPVRWKAPTVFSTERESAQAAMSPSATDVDALTFALNAEKESHALYAASRDKAEVADAKALFKFLADEEKGHYELLESALEYLNNTSSFFLLQEGAINEG